MLIDPNLARSLAVATGCALALTASPTRAQNDAAPPSRPNVVLMFADDLGTLDVGCYGAADLRTPHLDALAARGVRLTDFYANAAICSPSRAALLTGRVPQRAGVPGNVPIGRLGLPPEQTTIAETFRSAGYATAIVGKWHLGVDGPLNHGFESFFGHKKGCIDNWSHFFYWSGPNVHDLWRDDVEVWEDGTHFTDLMVREAQAFLSSRRDADEPFFLYLPFNIPHYPLQGLARFRALYADLPSPRREYAALVSTLDDAVGRVLGTLTDLGMGDDTIVVFLSDHGHSEEVRTMGGGGFAGPYRGAKFSLFEAGIRVPAIVSWPRRLPSGVARSTPACAIDLFPTLCELAGVPIPAARDGRSLVATLDGDGPSAPDDRALHWQQGKQQWAVRQGDWKLVVHGRGADDGEQTMLSNLATDPGERTNLAAKHADVVARLTALHEAWVATWKE